LIKPRFVNTSCVCVWTMTGGNSASTARSSPDRSFVWHWCQRNCARVSARSRHRPRTTKWVDSNKPPHLTLTYTGQVCRFLLFSVCTIVSRRLRLFGHIARADPSQDHSRALQAAINRLPTDWRRRRGRPRRTLLRTIESDLQPTNLGLNSVWLRAQDRSKWRSVVETAMLTAGRATWWWWWWL